jgi:hypothetical protein
MQKALGIPTATALLASACLPEPAYPRGEPPEEVPYAPLVDTAVWVDPPPTHEIVVPSSETVLQRWMLPGRNPWAPYQKPTLVTALDTTERASELPDVEQLREIQRASEAASYIASIGLPPRSMWVVDLRGAASVAFAARLSALSHEPISPVLTFHNWPADNETVPAEETLAALATLRPRPPPPGQAGTPMFLLDAWRLTHRYDLPDDEAVDNRYMLTASDLPDPSVLRAHGIDHVLYVVDSVQESEREEDDLRDIFLAYQDAGIRISMLDLDDILGAPPDGDLRARAETLIIDPLRFTVVGDPSFYHRARGGFGGVHVIYGGFSPGGHAHTFPFHGGG